jgi:pilus assembly protein CpaE
MTEMGHLLLVSSSDTYVRMLRFYFTKAGYEVESVRNTELALRSMQSQLPDVVLCEEELSGTDGLQLVRQLRASPVTARLPILALVSSGSEQKVQSAIAAGANDAIRRDANVQDIASKVTAMLGAAREPAEPHEDESAVAHTVTVLSARGGSGKTLLATNLGVALAQRKRETAVLLDLNLEFGTTAMMLDLRPIYTLRDIADAALNDVSDAEFDGMLLRHSSGLRVVPAVGQPGDSELIPEGSLPRIIDRLRRLYDHVVVDGRPSFREFMLDLWENSDTLLIACPPEVISVLVTRALLEAFGVINIDRDKVLIVLNQVAPRARLSASQVEKGLGQSTFTVPYGGDPLVRSVDTGKPYVLERPNEPTAIAIKRLADELLERHRVRSRRSAAAAG